MDVARVAYYCQEAVLSATSSYVDPRAHALRERYLRLFGGEEIPVPVESIAEDLLGLRIEERLLEYSGMLLPAERTIVLNAAESPRNDPPLRRHRFTIAHEIGHWVCHCLEGRAERLEPSLLPRDRHRERCGSGDRARGEHLRERAVDAGGGGAGGVGEIEARATRIRRAMAARLDVSPTRDGVAAVQSRAGREEASVTGVD